MVVLVVLVVVLVVVLLVVLLVVILVIGVSVEELRGSDLGARFSPNVGG